MSKRRSNAVDLMQKKEADSYLSLIMEDIMEIEWRAMAKLSAIEVWRLVWIRHHTIGIVHLSEWGHFTLNLECVACALAFSVPVPCSQQSTDSGVLLQVNWGWQVDLACMRAVLRSSMLASGEPSVMTASEIKRPGESWVDCKGLQQRLFSLRIRHSWC